ncbi:GLPGLI family protein [Arachidicoccus rhizosphaerae]|uniref:GLPGLI family protein n=1 Tax=Arachidicoccus rhizosphaerae TaxID=551991 RepID=A0A1H4BQG2_9BACT|nr:GLPGLI family protein [Arachidicoccus rhizosphaerae]SEA50391.1 GLPGLI family protein [Arachidicoccus rhizosphaerae]
MKPKKVIKLFLFFLLISKGYLYGQLPAIITKGKITFERRVNAYALLRDHFDLPDNQRFQQFTIQYKAANPQLHKTSFDLYFNDSLSFYTPTKTEHSSDQFIDVIASGNSVFTNLHTLQKLSEKSVADNQYIIKEPLGKIKWRYTNDTREILGFHCHRANAIILDSVYVVAFYTDQITSKSGPESFWGLPGMILQIALPGNYIVWEAKRVIAENVPGADFDFKPKGVQSNPEALEKAAASFLTSNIGFALNWFLLTTRL